MKEYDFEPYMWSSSGSEDKPEKCLICGEAGKGRYRALVKSKKSAKKIIRMFENLGLFAKVIGHDSKAPDVAFSRCEKHYSNVENFERFHRERKTITYKSIVDYLLR